MIAAAFAVLAVITSFRGIPRFITFDIVLRMSFMPAFWLPVCRSVLITSGKKPCFGGRHGLAPQETAATVADIEDHAALASREDVRLDLPLRVDDRRPPAHVGVHVRQDVAGTQVLVEQVVERQRRVVTAEVDHHRHVGLGAGLHGAVDRIPLGAGCNARP